MLTLSKTYFLQQNLHCVAGNHFETVLAPGGVSGAAKPSRADLSGAGLGRAEPSRAERSRAEPEPEPSRAEPLRFVFLLVVDLYKT